MTNHYPNTVRKSLPIITSAKKNTSKNRKLWRLGAATGLLGGIGLMFGAVFLTIFEYIYSEKSHAYWMFLVALPLCVLGAHCLDKIEELKKAERIEYCKRTGIKDKDCIGYDYTK